jgi:uncharacterized protein YndB with AHSA1/START domain
MWTDPEMVKRWWGPEIYTAPYAQMDVREGATSIVAMRSPQGDDTYSAWKYTRVVPHEYLEFVQSLCYPDGTPIDPVKLGLPADFPLETRTVVTFTPKGKQTEMTVTEHDFTAQGQMVEFAVRGLKECVDKMERALEELQAAA